MGSRNGPSPRLQSRSLLIFLFSLLLVISWDPLSWTRADVPSDCLQVTNDWPICGGLAGKYVDMQLGKNISNYAGILTSLPAGGTTLSNLQVVQNNLQVFFSLTARIMPNNVSETFVPSFQALHGCPNYTHYHRRYLYSMWCIVLVYSSPRCNTNVPSLCRDTCNKYIQGTLDTLQNKTQCPQGAPAIVSYSQTLQDSASVCEKPIFNGQPGNCVSGDTIEPGLCGYFPNSRECDPRTCPPGAPLCPPNAATSTSTSSSKTWIIVGGVAVGALVLGGLLLLVFRRQKKSGKSAENAKGERPLSKRISSMVPSKQPIPSTAMFLYVVLRDYEPKMSDELQLKTGDKVCVLQSFDDGWGNAINQSTGQQGVCPLSFLEPIDENEDDNMTLAQYDRGTYMTTNTNTSMISNSVQQPYMENITVNKLRARETTIRDDDD